LTANDAVIHQAVNISTSVVTEITVFQKLLQKITCRYITLHADYIRRLSFRYVLRGQLWCKQLPGCLEDMGQGRLLVIVDDARVSRLICHVAELFDMSCLAKNKTNDIKTALNNSRPEVILLDPEPSKTQGRNILRKLAGQHTDAAIVLTSGSLDQTEQLEDMGDSLGLNMAGALPDVFDADTLKQEFISIFQRVGQRLEPDTDGASLGVTKESL